MHQHVIAFVICFAFVLSACGPSEEQTRATLIAELTAAAPTSTETASPTFPPTITFTPTITLSPTITPTRTPKPTSTSTPTPIPGTYKNPATIGTRIVRYESTRKLWQMAATLLDVVRGDEADELARSEIDWFNYKKPIDGQEYLGVKVKLEALKNSDPNEVDAIYPYFSLTLRYSETGSDLWCVDISDQWIKGYVPIEAEGWVFFLIKKDSQPILYFHPKLIITEGSGIRTGGAYFSLEMP